LAHGDSHATTFPAAVICRAAGQGTGVVQPAATQPFGLTLFGASPEVG
jgi:hypothetical protein